MRNILQLGHVNFKNNPNTFLLHWDITSKCNYRCKYCNYENRDEQFRPYYEKERILEFISYISNKKDLIPILFGGEPTLDPNFLKIIKNFPHLEKYPIVIYTNLSRNKKFFDSLFNLNRDIKIITSFHYGQADPYDFYNKVLYLLEKKTYLRIKIMWDSRYKNIIKKIFYKFKRLENIYSNCFCTLDIVYGEDQDFTEEELDWYYDIQDGALYYIEYETKNSKIYETTSFNRIKMRAHRYHNGKVNLKFYRCDCGTNCLFITSDGNIFFCQTMRKNKRSPIFNLHTENYKDYLHIFNKNIICTEDNCHSEISVPKYRVLKNVGLI